jgi:hypothetical protein
MAAMAITTAAVQISRIRRDIDLYRMVQHAGRRNVV